MTTFLLDTSVIIDAINDKKNRNAALITRVEQGHILACCPVNVSEAYAGMSPKEDRKTSALRQNLHSIQSASPSPNLLAGLNVTTAIKAKPSRFPMAWSQPFPSTTN